MARIVLKMKMLIRVLAPKSFLMCVNPSIAIIIPANTENILQAIIDSPNIPVNSFNNK